MRILLATDGRPPALGAEELVRRLTDPHRVQVTILHAIEYGNELVGETYATEVLNGADRRFRAARFDRATIRAEGDPAVAIEKELAGGDYGLTVVGAGNHTWLDRLVFGSVGTHLLGAAPTPVLIVHRGPDAEHERIPVLVGTDGSPAAMTAIDTLIAVTTQDRVEVAVRSVVRPPDVSFAAYPGAVVPATHIEQATREAKETAARALDRSVERLHLAGFEVHGSLGSGWPATDLLDRADRDGADLVVVGARGIGRIERVAMGSVSAHVARHAPATLVAHPTEALGDRGRAPSSR